MTGTCTYSWSCGSRSVNLGTRTLLMGVLNVTPDSFSDGGDFLNIDQAVRHAVTMQAEGADIIDIGGESSRPGAEPVSERQELDRVIPVIEILKKELDCLLSIDTTKASVAKAAIRAGADVINDISACRFDPGMAPLAAETGAGVVIMHMQGEPRTMQENPCYNDVIGDIIRHLQNRMHELIKHNVSPEQLAVDPGIGFGKRLSDNYEILRRLGEFRVLERPVLVGPSRKSFIGKLLDLPVQERLEGTIAASTAAVLNGAHIIRAHDIKALKRAVSVADAIIGKYTLDPSL